MEVFPVDYLLWKNHKYVFAPTEDHRTDGFFDAMFKKRPAAKAEEDDSPCQRKLMQLFSKQLNSEYARWYDLAFWLEVGIYL